MNDSDNKNTYAHAALVALDVEMLASIGGKSGLASPLVSRLLTLFRQEAVKLVHGIENALANDDQEALQRSAHTLKSSCASVGAVALSTLAREIEYLARQCNLAEAAVAVAALPAEVRHLMAALDALEGSGGLSPT